MVFLYLEEADKGKKRTRSIYALRHLLLKVYDAVEQTFLIVSISVSFSSTTELCSALVYV